MVVVDCNATHCRWRPDVTFLHLDPEQVIFPRHDADAWAKGDKRTASEGSHIGKLVNINLEGMASRVHAFLKNMQLTLLEIETILATVANGNSIQEAACHWITSNKEKWEKWIPVKTACRPGDGLVDRRFNFVSTRQAAVDCGLCLPGHFSEILVDHLGQTRRCSQCSAGRSQRLSGATSCVDCAAGRFTAEPGQSECAVCPLGSYSTSRGSEGCERCGRGPKWTTNRLVKVDQEQRWIEVEGAASAMDCSCVAGWYLEHSTCKVCGVGTKCLGGELQLLPGYYSKQKNPGHVFQCFGSKGRCPGGSPGICAAGRDTQSVDCGCLPGLRSKGSVCHPCHEGDYFILSFLCCLLLGCSGLLHVASLTASQSKQQSSLINAIVCLNQMVTCKNSKISCFETSN